LWLAESHSSTSKTLCWSIICLGGVTIGQGAYVAPAALVNRDVEPHTTVGGIPARRLP
jgi:acetyltransferase-like isoleucine patch superfamily enzyme